VEYLGSEYPFYYENLDEATDKMHNTKVIEQTTKYLECLEIKEKMTCDYFLKSFANSSIYQKLKSSSRLF